MKPRDELADIDPRLASVAEAPEQVASPWVVREELRLLPVHPARVLARWVLSPALEQERQGLTLSLVEVFGMDDVSTAELASAALERGALRVLDHAPLYAGTGQWFFDTLGPHRRLQAWITRSVGGRPVWVSEVTLMPPGRPGQGPSRLRSLPQQSESLRGSAGDGGGFQGAGAASASAVGSVPSEGEPASRDEDTGMEARFFLPEVPESSRPRPPAGLHELPTPQGAAQGS